MNICPGNPTRYWLSLSARVDSTVSVEVKHHGFFSAIRNLPEPWGGDGRSMPSLPRFGRSADTVLSATKFFGPGVRRAMVTYPYRSPMLPAHDYPDRFTLVFDPRKIVFGVLTDTIIPKYIEAFGACRAFCFDERLIDFDWETETTGAGHVISRMRKNGARGIEPITFWDGKLCKEMAHLTPDEIIERVRGRVESARLLQDGVYVVGCSAAMGLEQAVQLRASMTELVFAK